MTRLERKAVAIRRGLLKMAGVSGDLYPFHKLPFTLRAQWVAMAEAQLAEEKRTKTVVIKEFTKLS